MEKEEYSIDNPRKTPVSELPSSVYLTQVSILERRQRAASVFRSNYGNQENNLLCLASSGLTCPFLWFLVVNLLFAHSIHYPRRFIIVSVANGYS